MRSVGAEPLLLAASNALMKALFLALPFVLWEGFTRSGGIGPEILPPLWPTMARIVELTVQGDIPNRIGETLAGWAASLGLSIVIALPIGVLIGSSDFAYRSSRLLIDALRSVPPLGLIPLALLLFGARRYTELMVTVPTMVWPIMLQVSYGIRDIDPMVLETSRSLRLSSATKVHSVILPAILPYLITGLRLASIMGLLLCIGVEVLTLVPGVGSAIAVAQSVGAVLDVYAYTLTAISLGVAMTVVTYLVETAVVPWKPASRGRV
ncbi:ABC transporter permease subunit [Inquilinus limosus]|uniref:ABC transporter permease n=1 Tax=Inquilinus limosus TaxID=171674 RepID=UPI003F161BD2